MLTSVAAAYVGDIIQSGSAQSQETPDKAAIVETVRAYLEAEGDAVETAFDGPISVMTACLCRAYSKPSGPPGWPGRAILGGRGREGKLNVEVQLELVRMRPQTYRIDFLGALVVEPGFEHILRKHITLGKELVVVFQRLERAFQRARY